MNKGNWIINIDAIKNDELAKIYATGDAGLSCGRIYIALPVTTILTPELIQKYNIWV
jgi:hypothetical protein